MERFYPTQPVTVLQPTDADTHKLNRRSTGSIRRTIATGRKARPVRKTVPADLAKVKDNQPAAVVLKPIEGTKDMVS